VGNGEQQRFPDPSSRTLLQRRSSGTLPENLLEMNRNDEMQRLYAEPGSSSSNTHKPKKLRRVSRACDFCHRRSIRCESSQEARRCQNCVDFDVDCTFLRPAKKRGIKGHRRTPVEEESSSGEHANLLLELTNSNLNHRRGNSREESVRSRPSLPINIDIAAEHRDMVLANLDKIQDLVSVYFEVVYPM
jgi:hypothetical protein